MKNPSFRNKALVYSGHTKVGHVIRTFAAHLAQNPRHFFDLLVGEVHFSSFVSGGARVWPASGCLHLWLFNAKIISSVTIAASHYICAAAHCVNKPQSRLSRPVVPVWFSFCWT